jgi:hypothetical protein
MRLERCLLVLALGPVSQAGAQDSPIQRNSVQLAGSASFTRTNNRDTEGHVTTFQLNPQIAWFVIPGLAVSANLLLSRSSGDPLSSTQWGIGPGLSYYFDLGSRTVYPFVSGQTLFSWGELETDLPPTGVTTLEITNRRWVVSGGALLMLARHVGVTGELFYQRASVSSTFGGEENEDRAEMYGLRWGIAAFVF